MNLTVNGQIKIIPDSALTLELAITAILPNKAHVIAELNGCLIKKDNWAQTPIKDGDQLELVTFVGGG